MIKKVLIIFTVAVLLVVSTTPALAQKPPDVNGKGISTSGAHANEHSNVVQEANANSNASSRNTATRDTPPPVNAVTTASQEISGRGINNARSSVTLGRGRIMAEKNLARGFDEWGYNRTARIFNGIALDWCMEKGTSEAACLASLGEFAYDRLVMKWNAEWDRGNDDDWDTPPYDAWENNEWNGNTPNGSGDVWHYKIVWVGPCTGGDNLPEGSYCIWNQFAVIMDQGTMDGVHVWYAHGLPTGYGAYP